MDAVHIRAPWPLVRFKRLRWLRRVRLDQFWLAPHVFSLARRTAAAEPDVVVVVKALGFRVGLLRWFRSRVDAPVWNYYPDIPYDPADADFNVVAGLAAYDGVLVWSSGLADRLRADGLEPVKVLRFGCDPRLYFPHNPPLETTFDVSFVGTWHPDRERVVQELGPVASGLVAGPRWERARELPTGWSVRAERIDPDSAREIYWRSSVVLNILHPLSVPGYNMRSFEVPASGAVMLATRTAEHQEIFGASGAVVLFGDGLEARSHLDRLLSDPNERAERRRKAVTEMSQATYKARALELSQALA